MINEPRFMRGLPLALQDKTNRFTFQRGFFARLTQLHTGEDLGCLQAAHELVQPVVVEGITGDLDASRAFELEGDGLVHREVYKQVPPKVEYSLTPYGKTLKPIIISLRTWGDDYLSRLTYERNLSVEACQAEEEMVR